MSDKPQTLFGIRFEESTKIPENWALMYQWAPLYAGPIPELALHIPTGKIVMLKESSHA